MTSRHYSIRVETHLDASWQEAFEGLQIAHEEQGTALLSGPIRDQATLYGVLIRLRDLGLTLLELSTSAPMEQSEQ